jgi:hypothetical protein
MQTRTSKPDVESLRQATAAPSPSTNEGAAFSSWGRGEQFLDGLNEALANMVECPRCGRRVERLFRYKNRKISIELCAGCIADEAVAVVVGER